MRFCVIRHFRMILSGVQSLFGVLVILVCVGAVAPPVEGFIIESPKEGATIVIGEPIKWKARMESKEMCDYILYRTDDDKIGRAQFSSEGVAEWTDIIRPEDDTLGKEKFIITGEPSFTCGAERVTLNVVLPPTTVLKSIDAAISSDKKQGFMTLYKHENGKLIQTSRSVDKVTAGGEYSDGVRREITDHPDTTYTSSDEKILKVTPPGKWMLNDEFPDLPRDAEYERPGEGALVTAVGPGRAKIIVRNGPHESSVTAIVNVEPCSEWKKQAEPGDLPVCD